MLRSKSVLQAFLLLLSIVALQAFAGAKMELLRRYRAKSLG